jgi:PAS domain S-box-containing protein
MLGYPGEDAARVDLQEWEAIVHPEDLARSAEMIRRHFAGELPRYDVELRLRHRGGEWVWVHLRGKLMTRSESGSPLFMFGTMTNATERKQAEAKIRELLNEKELLLREMRHRIKNNMNTLVAMLGLQADRSTNEETRDALAEARRRTNSLAVLYDKLYDSGGDGTVSLSDYLSTLVTDVVALFPGGERVTVRTAMDEVQMDAATASTLGTIVNELVTNAMKHAFPRGGEGTISLSGRMSSGVLTLEVADDGAGMPAAAADRRSGFGLELVRLLTGQLGAELHMDSQPESGSRARLVLRRSPGPAAG